MDLLGNKVGLIEKIDCGNFMKQKNKILVSACLAGVKCRYNGTDAFNEKILKELKDSELVIVCPELLGGETTPRPACNIDQLDGHAVLAGKAKIMGIDGKDYTESYVRGAKKALEIALANNVKKAYLKSKSPTCGCGKIFDSKGENLKIGNGIFAALLIENGIEVVSLD